MIAALYVETNGPYFGLPNVVPYDKARDARSYAGPFPVVAHPPCERWGNYAEGGPNPAAERRVVGDDGGCFDRGVWSVRNFGGVLEHPANSKAWRYYRISSPYPNGGWLSSGDGYGAWVCQVHQGHYGHMADKATWLYARAPRDQLPELIWGPCAGKMRLEDGFHSSEERAIARENGYAPVERLSKSQRVVTPEPFRDLLLSIAASSESPYKQNMERE